jgi:hypothetical protein
MVQGSSQPWTCRSATGPDSTVQEGPALLLPCRGVLCVGLLFAPCGDRPLGQRRAA